MPLRSNSLDSFNFAMRHQFRKCHHIQIIETNSILHLQWVTTSMCTLLVQLGQAVICRGPRQLRLCIACNNATDVELHVHTYAISIADIAAHEGSPHNVLHSSSMDKQCHSFTAVSSSCLKLATLHETEVDSRTFHCNVSCTHAYLDPMWVS